MVKPEETSLEHLFYIQYPERNVLSLSSFYRVVKKLSVDENVHEEKRKRQKTITGESNEIVVLAAVAHNQQISSCNISCYTGISRRNFLRILKPYKFHLCISHLITLIIT